MADRLRLALVTPTFLPTVGGTEILVYEVARRLVAWGHEVTLFTAGSGRAPQTEVLAGIRVVRGRFRAGRWGLLPFQMWLLGTLLRRRRDYDLVHQFHVFHAGGAVAAASRLAGRPLVTTLIGWDTYDELRPLPRILFPYLAWVMNRSDAVVAISNGLVPHAVDQGCRRPIEVQHLGTDLDRFRPDVDGSDRRAALGAADHHILAFALQRLDYRKRLEVLLQAISLCAESSPRLRFVIGGSGPERPRLERLIDELGIGASVRLIGYIPDADLSAYYAACDLFVLHSTYEGFGLVLADAMAAGKPVVATRVGAVAEVVAEGETGLLVPACNAEALAAAIKALASDREARERMAAAARRRAEERFDWDLVARRYLEAYGALLARR